MDFIRKLPIPKEIKAQFPLSAQTARIKEARDTEMKRIFTGESDKFILVIGPCSADREDAVLDYVTRLAKVQEEVKDKLFLIPRIYTGKPRTTGDGYKGLMHQPDPTAKPDMLKGIIAMRQLHLHALEQSGLGCADEMLYPENWLDVEDLLSSVAIGAIIYYLVLQFVLWLGLNSNDLKLLSALVVAVFLAIPYLKGKYFSKRVKPAKKGGASRA